MEYRRRKYFEYQRGTKYQYCDTIESPEVAAGCARRAFFHFTADSAPRKSAPSLIKAGAGWRARPRREVIPRNFARSRYLPEEQNRFSVMRARTPRQKSRVARDDLRGKNTAGQRPQKNE